MWSESAITFELRDDLSGEKIATLSIATLSIATLSIATPAGRLIVMGVPTPDRTVLMVDAVHIQGLGIGANSIGTENLRVIADAVMKRLGYDELVIQGALRTSGANPGRRPGVLRFTRRGGAPRES